MPISRSNKSPRRFWKDAFIMQEAIPYRTYIPAKGAAKNQAPPQPSVSGAKNVKKLVLENAVIIFGNRGCCMCHVVKRLLIGHGVNPAVFEVVEGEETDVVDELGRIDGRKIGVLDFPAVFVGGKLFGGLDKVMATHISGELIPILKDAGALWL